MRPARQTGANLGFEDKLWMAADKLRGTMDAAEYKHVVLGLIFLTALISGKRRFRHWRESTLNSHSAIFSQLPCLGVYTNSNFSNKRRAISGSKVLYNEAPRVGAKAFFLEPF